MSGAIIFLVLFPKNYILWQQHNTSRSCDPHEVRAVFSLPFLSLRGYDVTKKAWFGRNMVDYTKNQKKKNARYYSRDYCLLPFLFKFFFRKVISVDRSEHTSRRRALAKMLSPQSQSDQKSSKSSLLTFTLVSEPPGKEGSSINVTPCHFSYKVSYKVLTL